MVHLLRAAARGSKASVRVNPLIVSLNPTRLQAIDARIVGAHHD